MLSSALGRLAREKQWCSEHGLVERRTAGWAEVSVRGAHGKIDVCTADTWVTCTPYACRQTAT